MLVFWKVILTILILHIIVIDGNRVRRRRQAGLHKQNPAGNSLQQPPVGPNPRILNAPEQLPPRQGGPNDIGTGKQGGRQYYSPYQGQYGYGSVQGLNYPYGGAGVGNYQYGVGSYGQYGQGAGQYGGYNYQYPGSNVYYAGYGSGSSYNRPGYSNNNPSYSNYLGGYNWNTGQKQSINMFSVFLSSLLTLVIFFITA